MQCQQIWNRVDQSILCIQCIQCIQESSTSFSNEWIQSKSLVAISLRAVTVHPLRTTLASCNEQTTDAGRMEMELAETEAILTSLRAERASVRAMTKQSWNVVKTRVKKRLGRGGETELEEGEDLDDMTMDGGEDDLGTDTKALDAANPDETEMITVGKNGKTT